MKEDIKKDATSIMIADLRKEVDLLKADKIVLNRQLEEVKRLLGEAREDYKRVSYRAQISVNLIHELVEMTLHVKDKDRKLVW